MLRKFQTQYIDTDSGTQIIMPAKSTRHGTTGIIPNSLILAFYFISIGPNLQKSGQSLIVIILLNVFFLSILFSFFAYNLFTALWCSYGRETLTIDHLSCALSKTIFGIGPTRRFEFKDVTCVEAIDLESDDRRPKNLLQAIGIGSGKIGITYGKKEYFCGAGLEEEEEKNILNAINKYRAS